MIRPIIHTITIVISYFSIYFLRTSTFFPTDLYLSLLILIAPVYIVSAIYFTNGMRSLKNHSKSTLYIFIFTLFTISLIISITDLYPVSRLFILMVISLSTLLHWLTGFVFSEKKNESIDTDSTNEGVFKFKRLIVSLIILAISFLILNYSKTGGVKLYTWSDQVLFLLIGFWGVSGIITRKFYAYNSMNMYYKIAPIIKSQIFFILFSAVAFFFFRLEWLSRELLFGTILFFAILETLVFSIIFLNFFICSGPS